MITLYYVKGISRLDEPVFDTLENQKAFFHKCAITEVDTGFYPPHFQNQITISTDDASFDTACNYLSLTYGNKTYYYFIDSITYVAEDVISLNVTMDSIQTFMFNINVGEGHVTRVSIKRWDDVDKQFINRNYNRENLTQGTQKLVTYAKTTDRLGWFLIWLRDDPDLEVNASSSGSEWQGYDSVIQANKYPYEVVLSNGNDSAKKYAKPIAVPVVLDGSASGIVITSEVAGNTLLNKAPVISSLSDFVSDSHVFDIAWVPFDIYAGTYRYEYIKEGNKTLFNLKLTGIDTSFLLRYKGKDTLGACLLMKSNMTLPHGASQVSYLGLFKPNRSKDSALTSGFVPALLDENYFTISWGEQMSQGTYPLHRLQSPVLYAHYLIDWLSGTRIYYMSPSESYDKLNDPYQTVKINNSDESVDMYTDAYRDWVSRNKGTLTTGVKVNIQNIAYSFLKRGVNNIISAAGAMGQGFVGNYAGAISSLTNVIKDQVSYAPDAFMEYYNLAKDMQTNFENLRYTPDVQKQGNSYSADIFVNSLERVLKIEEVIDLLAIAEKYERLGYSVSYILQGDNPFNAFNYRWYYNVIMADLSNVYLEGVIESQEEIMHIKERFSSGLRLWNTDNSVLRARYLGDFQYDNVETAFIKE